MDDKEGTMNLGIVGASGQVGRVLLDIMEKRNFEMKTLRLFANSSAGQTMKYKTKKIVIEKADTASYAGLDIVIFSAGGATSKALAEKVVADGAIVIDNSSAWRHDKDVPLIVSEVNMHAADTLKKGIIANPNCTTMIAMSALKALDNAAGLEKLVISTYQAVSGAGLAGSQELLAQTEELAKQNKTNTLTVKNIEQSAKTFSKPIAYNILPHAGDFIGDETEEEQKLRTESRKILEIPNLLVSGTCVRVPVFSGHALSISAGFKNAIGRNEAKEILKNIDGLTYMEVPTPRESTGIDECLIGRVRKDETHNNGLAFFICGDNLRKGAALNTIQIAENLCKEKPVVCSKPQKSHNSYTRRNT